ncbi:MAG: cation transporter [Clostridia bacterium]|nr:cation transporter [Clostridia bacterium]
MTKLILRLFVRNAHRTEDPKVRADCGKVAGLVGIVTNLLLFGAKMLIGTLFHSVSITADAINNLTDSGSAIITMVGFKLAEKPADEKHPFGHARIEYLTGVIISFIVLFLGLEMGMSSIEKILHPAENTLTTAALLVLVLSVLVKLWQCLFYRKVGRMIRSETLEATSKDSRNDVISTAVVLVGAAISMFTGIHLDGWLGMAVAVMIIVSGVQLILDTADPLLGQAPDKELVDAIRAKILSYDGILAMHDLAVHSYGAGRCFASVHCEVDAHRDALESHDLIDNIERDFKKEMQIQLVIHMDPVVLNDPRANALKAQVQERCHALYPEVTLHDFRVVWGVTHSNVVFDLAVPFSVDDADAAVRVKVTEAVEALNPTYRAVITIDRG